MSTRRHRIATTGPCQIGLIEARAGIPFPAAAMAVVRAELSPAVARRLTLMAQNYGPKAALADGILDELAAPERLLACACAVARDLAAIPRDAYARIKHQLRADAIAANRAVLERGDPLAKSWLSRDVTTAAARCSMRRARGDDPPRLRPGLQILPNESWGAGPRFAPPERAGSLLHESVDAPIRAVVT